MEKIITQLVMILALSFSLTIAAHAAPSLTLTAASGDQSFTSLSQILVATLASDTSPTPGTVTFSVGSTPICSAVALVTDITGTVTASCPINPPLPAGSQTYTATYNGDDQTGPLTATTTVVYALPAPADLSIITKPNPPVVGQPATIIAEVFGSVDFSGTMTFTDGSTVLCAAVPVTITQQFVGFLCTATFAAGSHTLTAAYSGEAVALANSTSVTVVVAAAAGAASPAPALSPVAIFGLMLGMLLVGLLLLPRPSELFWERE